MRPLRDSGLREILRRLLARRFGPIPPGIDARIETATAAELATWSERILVAASPADVVAG